MQQERSGASVPLNAEFHEIDAAKPPARNSRIEPRTSKAAVAALVMATLSFVVVPLNLIAIFFGLFARRELRASPGRVKSDALAVTAILIGSTSLIATLLAAGLVTVRTLVREPSKNTTLTTSAPVVVSTPVEPVPVAPSPPAFEERESSTSTEPRVNVERLGEVVIAAIDPEVKSLFDSIDRQRALAHAEHRELLLWLVASDCDSCDRLETAFSDAKLQRILSGTRVVRLDVRQFETELRQLRIPTHQFPAFVRLNLDNNPVDYIDGNEWGENGPSSIAPVLEDFLEGRLVKRRHSWRGSEQDEETAI